MLLGKDETKREGSGSRVARSFARSTLDPIDRFTDRGEPPFAL